MTVPTLVSTMAANGGMSGSPATETVATQPGDLVIVFADHCDLSATDEIIQSGGLPLTRLDFHDGDAPPFVDRIYSLFVGEAVGTSTLISYKRQTNSFGVASQHAIAVVRGAAMADVIADGNMGPGESWGDTGTKSTSASIPGVTTIKSDSLVLFFAVGCYGDNSGPNYVAPVFSSYAAAGVASLVAPAASVASTNRSVPFRTFIATAEKSSPGATGALTFTADNPSHYAYACVAIPSAVQRGWVVGAAAF